jgi:hypothetical protein
VNAQLKDAAVSFFRVWVITTLGLWIPGLLGWVHEVSEWADQKGAPAFPDPSNLAFLFVAALTAAFPAALAAIVRLLENGFDLKLLPRPAGPNDIPPTPGETGAVSLVMVGCIVAVLGLLLWVLTTLDVVGVVLLVVGVALTIYAAATTHHRTGV